MLAKASTVPLSRAKREHCQNGAVSSVAQSPITGQSVPYLIPIEGAIAYTLKHSVADGFADLLLTEGAAKRLLRQDSYTTDWQSWTKPEQTRAALNLLRSYLWRVHQGLVDAFVVYSEGDNQTPQELANRYKGLGTLPFERFIVEADTLTFTEKCEQTLANIRALCDKTREPIHVPYARVIEVLNGPYRATLQYQPKADAVERGMCHGCDEYEAPSVLEHLQSEGFIEPSGSPIPKGFVITGRGRAQLDTRRKRRESTATEAFFVRSWDPGQDTFFENVMVKVEKGTGVHIQAVWDQRHNERIDTRIFSKIGSSPFVVLDITQRFNVGYEAGWAARDGKTLIAIRQKPDPYEPPPFDITTLNTYDYDPRNEDELANELVERIRIAIRENRYKEIG